MGVGGPKDFVANLNRFPVHFQSLTKRSNDRFVTTFAKINWHRDAYVPFNAAPINCLPYRTFGQGLATSGNLERQTGRWRRLARIPGIPAPRE